MSVSPAVTDMSLSSADFFTMQPRPVCVMHMKGVSKRTKKTKTIINSFKKILRETVLSATGQSVVGSAKCPGLN